MEKSVLSGVVLSSLLLCAQAQAQLSPLGIWTPIDEASGKPSAEIVISMNAAGTLSGVIQKSLIVPPGASSVCGKCTDDRKGKPTQGMEIIRGGKKLEVRGYIGSPMLGKTQTWVRGDR
jgi:uncharacterized protein (DUF2147 family)